MAKGAFIMGKKYYRWLRSLYRSSESVQAALQSPETENTNPELFRALVAAKKFPPNRSKLISYMSSTGSITKSECMGLAKFILEQSPSASEIQASVCITWVKMLCRLNATTIMGDKFELLHEKIDEILTQVLLFVSLSVLVLLRKNRSQASCWCRPCVC